jgi:MFS family permease
MSAVRVVIQPWFKKVMYWGLTLSWISGLCFFVMNQWITVEGEFGPEKHPWQFTVLQIHGAAAFLMLMVFGSMVANHIPMSWKTRRLRRIGIALLVFIGVQTVTAYLLYYLAAEEFRVVVSYLHLSVGFCLPMLLLVHLVLGKKSRSHIKKKSS